MCQGGTTVTKVTRGPQRGEEETDEGTPVLLHGTRELTTSVLLRDVLDALAVATIVLDVDGRITALNTAAEDLLRLPRGSWAARNVFPGQDDAFAADLRKLLAGEPLARETPVRLGDGSV